jgi:hypothetical protein
VGKLDDLVSPVTYTFPELSRTMELPRSKSLPPMKVEARRVLKLLLNFETKTSA